MALDREHAEVVTPTTWKTLHEGGATPVRIVDIAIPFGSMVVLLVKWTLAAIPAIFILIILGAVMTGFVTALLAALS